MGTYFRYLEAAFKTVQTGPLRLSKYSSVVINTSTVFQVVERIFGRKRQGVKFKPLI